MSRPRTLTDAQRKANQKASKARWRERNPEKCIAAVKKFKAKKKNLVSAETALPVAKANIMPSRLKALEERVAELEENQKDYECLFADVAKIQKQLKWGIK